MPPELFFITIFKRRGNIPLLRQRCTEDQIESTVAALQVDFPEIKFDLQVDETEQTTETRTRFRVVWFDWKHRQRRLFFSLSVAVATRFAVRYIAEAAEEKRGWVIISVEQEEQ